MGMRYVVILSKEHDELPFAELRAILEGEKCKFNLKREENVAFVDSDAECPIMTRAALAKEGGRLIQEIDDPEEIDLDLRGKSFSVRYRDFTSENVDPKSVESLAGSRVKGVVNLKKPEVELLLLKMDKYYLVLNERRDPGFNERLNEKRPFRTNLALQPKMARLLVNLGRVKEGRRILDPFCGGGSILIEASVMGIRAEGIDMSKKMYHGARMNIAHFGLNANVHLGDVSLAMDLGKFDAVVTDPPYGRGSSTNRESVESLYRRSFSIFRRIIDEGHVSIILPSMAYVDIARENFAVREIFSLKVHRSLMRYITVLS